MAVAVVEIRESLDLSFWICSNRHNSLQELTNSITLLVCLKYQPSYRNKLNKHNFQTPMKSTRDLNLRIVLSVCTICYIHKMVSRKHSKCWKSPETWGRTRYRQRHSHNLCYLNIITRNPTWSWIAVLTTNTLEGISKAPAILVTPWKWKNSSWKIDKRLNSWWAPL